jgi:hypothetical protein
MNYDIIGDIHGHADKLKELLHILGYQLEDGVYQHPKDRIVLFLGDFIDRGPKIREVLHIAKNMCDSGNAMAIMGNHEFNAIAFHTKDRDKGGFYRQHNYSKIKQHYATLEQFSKYPDEWALFLDWFKSLPIYLELDSFRAIHACWDSIHIKWLHNNFSGFTDEFIANATDVDHDAHLVVEELLKGKESRLENGFSFKDKDGTERFNCRVKWWQPEDQRKYFKDIMMECPSELKERELTHNKHFSYDEEKPVFFGHYWLKGTPFIENPKAICLDYSIAKDGVLVAYQSEYLFAKTPSDGFVFT